MKYPILLVTCFLVAAVLWKLSYTADARSSGTGTLSVGFARCFQDTELNDSLATLNQQGQTEVAQVYESLLARAKAAPGCRTELVQALIRELEASKNTTNRNEKFFLWQHGAGLLAELKAIEALDLLISNIDLTDGFESSLNDFPALVAILRIGQPAIPKLQIVLRNDSVPHRRKFAAFGIAYIGGAQARRALTTALPGETDPCVQKFLRLSLQAFNNKVKPNHISSALNGKWISAFYCL